MPGLEVHWLAQAPVTTLLEACGETVHPASAALAPEAAGVDAEAGEHELHAFQMLRRLDEIFCANFMVFHDLVQEEPFDLWIADEAWEVDYFLHENPELKTAPYVWLTDFVGVLPMPGGGEREAFLAADTNAQMVEHVARHPRLRDRSIFIGDPDDIVPEPLGPGLPGDPRRGPRSASGSPATSPASTPPRSPTATRCARSSATSPASRSASSRPAAPAPGSTSCSAPPPRSRRRSGASPSCA